MVFALKGDEKVVQPTMCSCECALLSSVTELNVPSYKTFFFSSSKSYPVPAKLAQKNEGLEVPAFL